MNNMGYTGHRPYVLPSRPWIMRQVWQNFIFVHWPVSMESIRALVPSCLEIDTFDRQAWIGIYTFRTQGLYLRGFPSLSLFSPFYGINLRTYVTYKGKPGVYFIHLNSTHWTALRIARAWYRLNYFHAKIRFSNDGEYLVYDGIIQSHKGTSSTYHIRFSPESMVYYPQREKLDYFLTERYCLYSVDSKDHLYCAEIHHSPWPLQKANAEILNNSLTKFYNLQLTNQKPVFHFSKGVDVLIWNINRL